MLISRHHDERHQIFEHGAAPGQENRLSAGDSEKAAQGKPAFLRHLSLSNGNETAETRLRRQQVIVAFVPSVFVHVVADGEEMAGLS